MRILFTIPHYYRPQLGGKHGSTQPNSKARMSALTGCLSTLRQCFGTGQGLFDISRGTVLPVNQSLQHHIDIIICTTRDRHLLDGMTLPAESYILHPTKAKPTLLGFECQAVLRDRLGSYDYYCYLEDDLLLADPWFFAKLSWFTKVTGSQSLLQPNRFESRTHGRVNRAYIDGDISPEVTARFQRVQEFSSLTRKVMDTPVRFRRALNPHSGCYFLNAEQMNHWAEQKYFLDYDTSFIGPLESAATLGIMKTFRVYKPAPQNASFLEIQHYGSDFMKLINRGLQLSADWTEDLFIAGGSAGIAAWEQVVGWFSRDEAIALQRLVRSLPAGARVVELGSFQGRSSIAIASVLPERSTLFCVDHFKGSAEHQGMKLNDLYATFLKNIRSFGVTEVIQVLKMTTKESARRFKASSVDLVLVDAAHDFASVKSDMDRWYPKLKPGGWLVCDDYHSHWPEVMNAVNATNLKGDLIAPALWAHRKSAI